MGRFLKYYEEPGSRPVFETVDEMLKWAGLYNLTTRTLEDELVDAGLSPLLINELVTVRILTILLNMYQQGCVLDELDFCKIDLVKHGLNFEV